MRRIAWVAAAVGALLLSSTAALAQRGDDKATLVLESQPAGVDILIDGDSHGLTPRSVEVKAGAHEVRLVKEGFEAYRKKVTVKAGEKLRLKGTLKAAVAKGKPAVAKGKAPAAKEAAKASSETDKGAREEAKEAAKAAQEADRAAAKAAKEEARKARAEAKEAAKADKGKAKEKPAISKGPAVEAAGGAKGPRDATAEAKDAREAAAEATPAKHDLPHADMDDRTKAAKAAKADDDLRAVLIDDPAEAEPVKRPPKPANANGAAAVTAPPVGSAPAVPVAPVADQGGSSGPSLRTIGWIGLGVGLALTGGAIYTNVLTNQRYDALTKAGKDRNGLTVGTTQVDARSSMDKANTFRTVSSVLYVVGGTAVGVSAFLVAFGDSDWSTNGMPAFAVSPLPGGGVVSVQGGF